MLRHLVVGRPIEIGRISLSDTVSVTRCLSCDCGGFCFRRINPRASAPNGSILHRLNSPYRVRPKNRSNFFWGVNSPVDV
jgi:hypothetical protein